MKYLAFTLLLLWVVILFVFQPFSKNPVNNDLPAIDTIICIKKEYYADDTIVGDKCLVVVVECDTIYKTK